MYGPGDQWRYQEANEVVRAARIVLGRGAENGSETKEVEVRNFKNLAAYSVFGLGDSAPVPHGEQMRIIDPISDSHGPLYTNGSDPIGAGNCWVTPIGAEAVRLATEGDIEPGDFAEPTDDGRAKKGNGSLLCVKTKSNDHAWYVFRTAPSGVQHVRLEKVDGDAGSSTVDCSFTYNAFDLFSDSKVNDNAMSPWSTTHVRPSKLQLQPAKFGHVATINGVLRLLSVNETVIGVRCEDENPPEFLEDPTDPI